MAKGLGASCGDGTAKTPSLVRPPTGRGRSAGSAVRLGETLIKCEFGLSGLLTGAVFPLSSI